MKNSVRAALCLSLVVIMLVSLVACGGVAGRYDLVSMEAGGESLDISALQQLAGTEVDMYIELKSDGTGVMKMEDDVTDMVYEDGMIWPVGAPDEKVSFKVDGDTLTLEQEGIKMIFKKK